MNKGRRIAAIASAVLTTGFLCIVPVAAFAWDTVDVPEPGVLVLFALGLGALSAARLRHRR